jgi:hypothetical protein
MLLPLLLNNLLSPVFPPPPPTPTPSAPTAFTATITARNIIAGALRRINAYASGQQIQGVDAQDLLETFNDMLDGWSINKLTIFSSTENILQWQGGKNQYTIGNPVGGIFSGTVNQGSPIISNVLLPPNLVEGGSVIDARGFVPAGAKIASNGIGTNTVALTLSATATTPLPEQFQYTTPGDFAIDRPVRITNAFTRLTSMGQGGLDFPIEIIALKEWNTYLLKNLPGPWPLKLYYDPSYPLGTIYCYPAPSGATELHLWTDTTLTQFANIDQQVSLPQGYLRALKWNLAQEIWTEYYDDPLPAAIVKMAAESKKDIERLNVVPQPVSRYDRAIMRNRGCDAGWILSGGFTNSG